jgi:hypothetical protein
LRRGGRKRDRTSDLGLVRTPGEAKPLGKSVTYRGVFRSRVGSGGAVLGQSQAVAGMTTGITERLSRDRRNSNLAFGFRAQSHFIAARRVSSSVHAGLLRDPKRQSAALFNPSCPVRPFQLWRALAAVLLRVEDYRVGPSPIDRNKYFLR